MMKNKRYFASFKMDAHCRPFAGHEPCGAWQVIYSYEEDGKKWESYGGPMFGSQSEAEEYAKAKNLEEETTV